MPKDQDPDKGPQDQDTVYKPGEPGGQWTPEEVESTRQRILLMITPLWLVQMAMVGCSWKRGCVESDVVYENALIRLAFHDCVPYADGTGGCNGCLDWNGMIKTEGNSISKLAKNFIDVFLLPRILTFQITFSWPSNYF